jgi:uncharacterized membrane protein YdbT with pleckstrin-like domain
MIAIVFPYKNDGRGGKMSYIEKNLMNGENILYRASLHWVVFLWSVVWFIVAIMFFSRGGDAAVIAGRLFILIAIVKAVSSFINFSTSEFAVTNQRVIAKVGFIRRNSLEVLLGKIEAIQVNQDILGRILGYGSITVSGTGGTRDPFHNISDPLELRRKIQEQVATVQKP